MMGLLYQEDEIDFDLQVLTADANGKPIGTFSQLDADDAFIGSGSTIFGRTLSVESENSAVFGEINYQLSDTMNLTLGARYFESESESASANTHPFFGFQGNPIEFQNRSTEDNKATFKANLT
ncbi:MAG: TonB-dependent receptor [Pseudomonadales bacterium]|nr:TonB-dependent receptor [Pseudomonadales bacterium]MCP5213965.1 TonB-dependent receptor [Pseudomonadales bacterium]MCP5302825.1 TonB-dependent receptor [Pseudomonadales bacterium]